jgi:hypothetical protein
MTLGRTSFFKISVVLLAIALPLTALAQPIGKPFGGGASIEFQMNVSGHDRVEMMVLSPSGETYSRTFPAGRPISFRLLDLGANPEDGQYNYQLTLVPKVSEGTKRKLADAREAGDDAQVRKIQREEGLDKTSVLSGTFTILNGSIVNPDGVEGDANDSASAATAGAGRVSTDGVSADSISRGRVTVLDQVIPDDLIVQSSTCTGFDCVDGESFGFDTFRLKENNLRIHFDDTSSSAGYPANDWRLIANDSASGGANKFVIEDSTAARNPMTIEADAPANALYVDSTGNIGLQQSAPGLDLHLTMSDTPAIRLEQTNAGGFTAQTWDIGANEANFFIRDLTGGSRLSFRIRPGAPTSSVDISSDGDVGINTASPHANTKMDISDSTQNKARLAFTGQEFFQASNTSTEGVALMLGVNRTSNRQLWLADTANMTQNSTNRVLRLAVSGDLSALGTDGTTTKSLTLNQAGGFVGIATANPAAPLQVGDAGQTDGNAAFVSTGGVWTNGSSRTFKEHIEELSADEAVAAVAALKPVRYNYIREPNEKYVGFIAEDVPELVAAESYGHKYLSPMDIVATLTKVVQEQQKTIDELSKKVDQLSNEQ